MSAEDTDDELFEQKSSSQLVDCLYTAFVSVTAVPFISRFLKQLVNGTSELLDVNIPSVGQTLSFGGQKNAINNNVNVSVRLFILRPVHFCWRLLLDEKLGLGEAFVEGAWRAEPGVQQFLALLIRAKREKKAEFVARRNAGTHVEKSLYSRFLMVTLSGMLTCLRRSAKFYNYIQHRFRDNTIFRSRKNISEHYDLGNRMFEIFLDETMTYSCALFEDPNEPLSTPLNMSRLARAQTRKIDSLLDSLHLSKDDHVLEIGCGWGSAAIRAVQRFGCKWTALTISTEQLELAQEKITAAGVEENVEIKLLDYRLETGKYSAVLSIEMIEAVGQRFLPEYFRVIHDRLLPGGRAAIQAILCPDAYYSSYCNSSDFIRKHIFPGGHLPSLGAIEDALPRDEEGREMLEMKVEREMARHYAHTLDHWHSKWLSHETEIRALGYSAAFHRKWQFYFELCAALFAHDHISVAQISFRRSPQVISH